jgi:hypothetical protein
MEKSFTDIESLARFIFLNNTNNNSIDMVIHQDVYSSKQLFYICVELLTKGLQLLYSDNNGKVTLQSITLDQINFVKNKLKLAKINFEVDIINTDDILLSIDSDNEQKYTYLHKDNPLYTKYNELLNNLIITTEYLDDDLNLNEYCFTITLKNSIYFIKFNLLNAN